MRRLSCQLLLDVTADVAFVAAIELGIEVGLRKVVEHVVDGALLGGLESESGEAMPTPEEISAWVRDNAPGLMVSQLINAALGYIGMALTLSVASIAFRICTGWVPSAPPGPTGT